MKLLKNIFIGVCVVIAMLSGIASHHAGSSGATISWLLVLIVLLLVVLIGKVSVNKKA